METMTLHYSGVPDHIQMEINTLESNRGWQVRSVVTDTMADRKPGCTALWVTFERSL